jgi:hypothetical protein
MPKLKDVAAGAVQEAGSWLVHAVPSLQGFAARHVTKLTEPQDLVLRWRRGEEGYAPFWTTCPATPGANPKDLSTWGRAVFGAERETLAYALREDGRRPAVGYRLGTVCMIGAWEGPNPREFLQPVTELGEASVTGSHMGVVLRPGTEPLTAAIGSVGPSGEDFRPVLTTFLAQVVQTPEGLHRV